jgi:hypothetical protein
MNEIDRINDTVERIHTASLSSRTIFSKKLTLTEAATFDTSSLSDITHIRSYTKLFYDYSKRLKTTMSLNYHYRRESETTRNSLASNVNAIYTRRLARNLSSQVSASVSHVIDDLNQSSSENLSGTLSYSRPVMKGGVFTLGASVGLGAQQGDNLDNRTSISSSVSTAISKYLRNIKTKLSLGGSYRNFRTSQDGASDKYSIDFRVLNEYIRGLSVGSDISYLNEDTVEDRIDSQSQKEVKKDVFSTDTYLRYSFYMPYRGRGYASAGFATQSGTSELRYYYGSLSMFYLLARNLKLTGSVQYSRWTIRSFDTLLARSQLNYRFRMVFLKLRYEYYQAFREDVEEKRQHLMLHVIRRF